MFRDRFVACLKVKGQILRESEDTVRLPFGSEYSLFLRNYEGRRAVVKVEIDGQDVLGGRRLVVEKNSSLELERFIKDGDLTKGNRFKFIHKDEKIVAHRGDKVDDGIVRISWQYEQPQPVTTWSFTTTSAPQPYRQYLPQNYNLRSGGTSESWSDSVPCNAPVAEQSVVSSASIPVASPHIPGPMADEGITVAGSHSTQTFSQTYVGALEPEVHVITLKLLGESPLTGQVVEKPVMVREKLECPTCGTDNTSKHHFCGHCGTCLGD